MKKLCGFLMLLCLFAFIPTASAAIYPDYWRNDTNFPLVWGHMGTARYMDKTSLVVQRYDPPNYVIAVNVITVYGADSGNTEIARVDTFRYYYNYENTGMYTIGDNEARHYIKPTGSNAESGLVMYVGEAAFYTAYHMKFYGAQNWNFGSFYSKVFDDDFYACVNGARE